MRIYIYIYIDGARPGFVLWFLKIILFLCCEANSNGGLLLRTRLFAFFLLGLPVLHGGLDGVLGQHDTMLTVCQGRREILGDNDDDNDVMIDIAL